MVVQDTLGSGGDEGCCGGQMIQPEDEGNLLSTRKSS